MLEIKKISENVIEVKETLMGFTNTKYSFWYYDIKNWLVSSHGKENDVPDRVMTESGIDWCKKYYIPKIKE